MVAGVYVVDGIIIISSSNIIKIIIIAIIINLDMCGSIILLL